MRFHQNLVKDEMLWAYMSDLKNAAEIAQKRANDESEDRQRMLAAMSNMSRDMGQERHGKSNLQAALLAFIYTGAQ
jgi:hypothetical protein